MWPLLETVLVAIILVIIVTQIILPPFINKPFFWILRGPEKAVLEIKKQMEDATVELEAEKAIDEVITLRKEVNNLRKKRNKGKKRRPPKYDDDNEFNV
jgi:hypothetical protein